MHCPACAAEAPDDDLFCESCGQRLGGAVAPTPAGACACGAASTETDEDGFCLHCGLRARRAQPSDHIEEAISPFFAAVSDKGIRHDRNEDRFALAEDGGAYGMVVCDGVSTTHQSELASTAVTQGAIEALKLALGSRAPEQPIDAEALLSGAIAAGAARLSAESMQGDRANPASTTVVAALVAGNEGTVAWLGDSRAYWIDAASARPLTHDHSWMNEVLALGGVTAEQAAKAPQAHAITRWIGADATDKPEPEFAHFTIGGPGLLLLCTDGLWNYAPSDEALGNLVRDASVSAGEGGPDVLEVARKLVQFAIEQGGQDNITAAILRFSDRDRLIGAARPT